MDPGLKGKKPSWSNNHGRLPSKVKKNPTFCFFIKIRFDNSRFTDVGQYCGAARAATQWGSLHVVVLPVTIGGCDLLECSGIGWAMGSN